MHSSEIGIEIFMWIFFWLNWVWQISLTDSKDPFKQIDLIMTPLPH